MIRKFNYDSSNPHYTPDWLSEQIARQLPRSFRGSIVDPACGGGNLLAAAAIHLARKGELHQDINVIGLDICAEATVACSDALATLVERGRTRICTEDFLRFDVRSFTGHSAVVMNPPFLGYGRMPKEQRKTLASELGMRGKFNLSHAFVLKAIKDFSPSILVAVLPSNWYYSKSSFFRAELDALGGNWRWESVGDAFEGVATHVGVLVWNPGDGKRAALKNKSKKPSETPLVVRQGVATGRDDVFRSLAKIGLPYGSIVTAIVGKDVERGGGSEIWLPTFTDGGLPDSSVMRVVPRTLLRELKRRACVREGGKHPLSYHEGFPSWFLGVPKLLLPEVVSGDLRVELDKSGEKLPLHSVFALRVPSVAAGEALQNYLKKSAAVRRILQGAPKLAGGAVRLNVQVLRQCLAKWEKQHSVKNLDRQLNGSW